MKSTRPMVFVSILVLIAVVGLVSWRLGHSSNTSNNSSRGSSTTNAANTAVKSLVGYRLPDAWTENTCSSSSTVAYIIPNGTSLNCSANPSSPIKIYVDSQDTTDCQQLKPVDNQGIKKHVCISLYINGHKSLKASTTRSSSGDTTVSDYYINSGKGVVAIEYTYTSANDLQTGFDQLATSVKVN